MLTTTTNSVEGRRIVEYLGIVSGQAVLGAKLNLDFFGKVRNVTAFFGFRTLDEREAGFVDLIDTAIAQMAAKGQRLGADAIIGIDINRTYGIAI